MVGQTFYGEMAQHFAKEWLNHDYFDFSRFQVPLITGNNRILLLYEEKMNGIQNCVKKGFKT